jgi:nitroimidazol reductase NimA-like FMN-containing flavoprotein (pyridoxamine 5'-phosphate oxidase superfamily)
MATFQPTPRTQMNRQPQRAIYGRDEICAILDESSLCHIGFAIGTQPYVIPVNYARRGNEILIHGSPASRMMCALAAGTEACITVTLVDGLVLARAAAHHSMNYRSVVMFGMARVVSDPAEQLDALRCLMDHILPGRWKQVRPPSEQELKDTMVLAIPITEASAKMRRGPALEDDEGA